MSSEAPSLSWISRMMPRESVRVDRASVIREGWVWKKSRRLGLWRRRWMVLTTDGQLVTFEDESQQHGATDRFVVRQPPPLQLCPDAGLNAPTAQANGDAKREGALCIEVEYASKRRAMQQMFSKTQDVDGTVHNLRPTTLIIDAGQFENRRWTEALREVFHVHRRRSPWS
mmetsp:Transcript_35948/g.99017  ORF Transcript_35948/g.99017 Transcript_35948/m.99017 type:complete len:171 (-) Transcript_35948:88-600(-)